MSFRFIRRLAPALFMFASAASATTFPIRPGTYVRTGVPCDEASFADMFEFDGKRFSYPHASACSSRILSRAHGNYRVREICRANGDGSPARPDSMDYIYRFPSPNRIHMTKFVGRERSVLDYRRCPSQ